MLPLKRTMCITALIVLAVCVLCFMRPKSKKNTMITELTSRLNEPTGTPKPTNPITSQDCEKSNTSNEAYVPAFYKIGVKFPKLTPRQPRRYVLEG